MGIVVGIIYTFLLAWLVGQ